MTREQAVKCWNQIKAQLEESGSLKLVKTTDKTIKDIETQQIQTILGWGNQ